MVTDQQPSSSMDALEPLLKVENLCKTFRTTSGLFSRRERVVHAVDHVSFTLHKGETIGIVGESGSGKSTLGRCLVRLEHPDSGSISLGDINIASLAGEDLRRSRSRVQMIFQDPFSSLNPRARVSSILTEGPVAFGATKQQALERAIELLRLVGLDEKALTRFPHEFSGGQRQRIGIARALALDPEIIVADEAVSALDVSIQAQVLELLADLKKRLNLSMLFVTHDLRVAAQICDRIVVLQQGKIVEIGATNDVLRNPKTDYAKKLLAAVPGVEYEQQTLEKLR